MEPSYCDPPILTPEPEISPSAPRGKKIGCQNSCCDDLDAKVLHDTVQAQEKVPRKKLDNACSPCEDKDSCTGNSDTTSDCCRGKSSPCCDASCLDRIARRECTSSDVLCPNSPSNTSGTTSDRKACSQHSLSALDRWGATLQTLGCICRALIALGEETCCEVRERHSPALSGKQDSSASSTSRLARTSLDSVRSNRSLAKDLKVQNLIHSEESARAVKYQPAGTPTVSKCPSYTSGNATKCKSSEMCCPKGESFKQPSPANNREATCCADKKPVQGSPKEQKCSSSCCSGSSSLTGHPKKQMGTKIKIAGSCCSKNKPAIESPISPNTGLCCRTGKDVITKESVIADSSGSCCGPSKQNAAPAAKTGCTDPCCSEIKPVSPQIPCVDACCSSPVPDDLRIDQAPVQGINDIENQGAGKEHVILNISGMTCTGCETKLNRTLGSVAAVENLKTSLVLSRAEFNINLRLGSVEEIMKHLERTTEFKCKRVQIHGSSLDLIVPDDSSKFISQKWPEGVIDIVSVDKQTVRVAFDPKVLGARDVSEKIWGLPTELAPPRADPSLETGSKHVLHVGYMTLLSALLTIPVLVMAWAPLPHREMAYSSASLALATIVQVVIAGPFYPKALKALLFSRVIEMDLLIVLSTSAAYVFSVVSFGYLVAGNPLSTGRFFETSTLLVTLIMVGRWAAAFARQKAIESISIRSLQSQTAILVDEDGREREIDARLLQYGDVFKVLPDTKIPTDGTVISGSSEVDESMLTGESRPVEKYPESVVIAGSINGSGILVVQLTRLPSENTINTIAVMVDEAKLSKPKLQDLADRVAAYFVPVIVALTIITFVIWVAVGIKVRGQNGSEAAIQAITYAITVLIVSCPCAIGLAIPMVVVISSGLAAERGIVFKSANAIELAYKTMHVVFDKTGTLTRGKLSVVAQSCVDEDKLPILLGLIENNRHPVSVSVAAHLRDAGIVATAVPDSKHLTGKGIEASLNSRGLRAGNSRWLDLSEHGLVQPMLARGYTVFSFTVDDELVAVYGLEDEPRPDAIETIEILKRRGVSVHMVSGDDDGAVQTLAAKLNIPGSNVRCQSSPVDKRDYIQQLFECDTDHERPVVLFCGDGTNDAVALAQSTIGVHMNEGTDIAQSAADVVLMRPSLASIPILMSISQKAVNRIKFNFTWSFIYNTFAVLLAAGAFVNARIPPEFAGLGELVSVLPVIVAAVFLRWSRI